MTTRAKITAYIPPDLADALRRVAAIKDRSVSDVVEDAIAKSFTSAGREAEQAALMARFDLVQRRLGLIERSQETLFELTAHAARFSMSIAPEIRDGDRPVFNARGAERFRNVVSAIVNRLASGRSVWRDHFVADLSTPAAASPATRSGKGSTLTDTPKQVADE